MKLIKSLIATLCFFCLSIGYANQEPSCKVVADNIKQCDFTFSNTHYYGYSNLPFALCSKALCLYDSKSDLAKCHCPVFGIQQSSTPVFSVGPKPYADAKPTLQNGKVIEIISNYSFANLEKGQKAAYCNFEQATPWANCYGIRCKMDYSGKEPTAICICPVVKSKEFVSSGPTTSAECPTKENQIWSAADGAQGQANYDIMTTLNGGKVD